MSKIQEKSEVYVYNKPFPEVELKAAIKLQKNTTPGRAIIILKGKVTTLKSYRPVALINALCKIFKKMIKMRLVQYL